MHHLVILTAMTMTGGLFGGGRCHTGQCGRPAMMSWSHGGGCGTSACQSGSMYAVSGSYQGYVVPAPAPAAAPAPAPQSVPVPPPAAAAPQTQAMPQTVRRGVMYYPSYYYSAAPACPNGNCPRR